MPQPTLRRTESGVQVYGVQGVPDGYSIPYDYDPSTDSDSEEAKKFKIQILQYAAQQDAQGGEPTQESEAPLGGYVDDMQPAERMTAKGARYLSNRWSWFDKSEPTGMYRKQRYSGVKKKTTKKPVTKKKPVIKKRAPTKTRKTAPKRK